MIMSWHSLDVRYDTPVFYVIEGFLIQGLSMCLTVIHWFIRFLLNYCNIYVLKQRCQDIVIVDIAELFISYFKQVSKFPMNRKNKIFLYQYWIELILLSTYYINFHTKYYLNTQKGIKISEIALEPTKY